MKNQGDFPLVSVIVPAYNHQRFIVECLESIASSTYPCLEVLVLDDGSADHTYDRALRWMSENSHRIFRGVVRQQTNRGLTATLNRLVTMATGEFVAVVASDDLLLPDGIRARVSALQRSPDLLGVFGDCRVVDLEGRVQMLSGLVGLHKAHLPSLLDSDRISMELILRWSPLGPGLLVRRRTFDAASGVGMYDEGSKVEDRDFYLRLLAIDALGFITDVVADYRLHGMNSVVQNNPEIERDLVRIESRNREYFSGVNRLALSLVAVHRSAKLRAKASVAARNWASAMLFGVGWIGLSVIHRIMLFASEISSRGARPSVTNTWPTKPTGPAGE